MSKESNNIAGGVLLGAVVGFIAGILMAPKSGKDTRHDIANAAIKVADQAEKKLRAAQHELSEFVNKAEEQAKKVGRKISFEAKESIENAKHARAQTAEALAAFKRGESTNEDLDIAVKNAHSALDSLKTYFKK